MISRCRCAPDLPDKSSVRMFFVRAQANPVAGSGGTPTIGQLSRRRPMYFTAAVLVVLSGVFYAAGHHELGSFSGDVCRYGGAFCDNPLLVLVFAGLAAVWATFVSVR